MTGILNTIGGRVRSATFAAGVSLGLVIAAPTLALSQPLADGAHADFRSEAVSSDARQVGDWVVQNRDNSGGPFIIIDKKATKVFVFDGYGNLQGATTALLGLARGDDSAPGIGDRKLSNIPPEERTTPAGRFVASLGLNLTNQDILWVDYNTALALHRVLDAGTAQHRLERLAAKSPLDRRITFGCINVPVSFYEDVVRPQFVGRMGVVYILPETKSLQEVFFQRSASTASVSQSPIG